MILGWYKFFQDLQNLGLFSLSLSLSLSLIDLRISVDDLRMLQVFLGFTKFKTPLSLSLIDLRISVDDLAFGISLVCLIFN